MAKTRNPDIATTDVGSPATSRGNLTLAVIVESAVQTIQKDGLGGLSMRQLAGVLNVTPTAIYHHVRDKDEMLDLCAQALLARIPRRTRSRLEAATARADPRTAAHLHALSRSRALSARAP